MEKLSLDNQNVKHVQAYLDYVNIVGYPQEGEELLTEEEFQKFNEQMKEKAKNRVFASWRNSKGIDCKVIGPATKCFCDHRFKEHNYLDSQNKKIHCKNKGCKCQMFDYIPTHGSYDFKCLCKHSYRDHDSITKRCIKGNCGGCKNKFSSTWACLCGMKYYEHKTVFENHQERIQQNRDTGDLNRLNNDFNAGMQQGGLTSFSNLIDNQVKEDYFNQKQQLGMIEGGNKYKPIQNQEKCSKNIRLQQLNQNLKKLNEIGVNENQQQQQQKLQAQKQQQQLTIQEKQQAQNKKTYANLSQETKQQQKVSQTQYAEKKINNLNQKIIKAQEENKFNLNFDFQMEQEKEKIIPYQNDKITALDLFNTPHIYGVNSISYQK